MPPKLPTMPAPGSTPVDSRPPQPFPSTPAIGTTSATGARPQSPAPAAAVSTPTPSRPTTTTDLNQIVLDYLSKRGYSKTEAMLRMESARTVGASATVPAAATTAKDDKLGKITTDDPQVYIKAYVSLRDWIETSLDLFKPELRKLLFPIFVHTFFYLISEPDPAASSGATTLARKFFDSYSPDHAVLHGYDLQLLSGLTLPEHLKENETAKLYREHKYTLHLSRTTFDLLLHFLDENERNGGPVTVRLINQYIDTQVKSSRPDRYDDGDQVLGAGEGIPGHVTGQETKFNTQPVKLGKLPMDDKMARDVEMHLKQEDRQSEQDGNGLRLGTSLVDEFHAMQAEDQDAPSREQLPLPQYKGVDVETEIAIVKDARSRLHVGPVEASLPSVCMYTFHNTYDGLNCLEFSDDSTLVAGGFADSYVKVWSLKGEKLQSVIKSAPLSTSKRLVGHAGPVYGVAFSPDNRYLLSCSEDKTARLWSMDTYTALVSYKGHNHPVWDVAFSPHGHYFATASHDQTARLWSCDHVYPLRIFAGHLSDVNCVTFHPNSTYVLTGSSDKSCRMWDVARGAPVRVMLSHGAPVSSVAVSPDGRTLASGADDGNVMLWDLGSGRKIKTMRGHDRGAPVYSLAFSKEGSVLVSAGADYSVRVWDVKGASTADTGALAGAVGGDDNIGQNGDGLRNGNGSSSGGGGGGAAVVTTADHMAAYKTKQTPVYKVKFTRRNLCLAGGAFVGAS
ncbi:WD40-repeat-containing domain protein [Lipomyces arxii]|uniref:WD40-repeat-containing domain protein n=1 Tax=Lipomyces arxii TaxID=56418 RepID=UPI0034CD88F5